MIPERLHPQSGQGLSDRQRPAARLRLAGADGRGDGPIQKIVAETPGVAHTVDIPGQSFVMNGVSSNFGTMFIILKPFHERRAPELYSEAIANELRMRFMAEIEQAQMLVFGAPAVDGLGNAGGFKLMLEGTGNVDLQAAGGGDGQLLREGEQAARLHRPVQQLPRRHAAALRGRGPRQVQDDEGGPQRRFRHVAGLPGRLLRQRLQPLRPHLAGERPGRRPLPHQRRDGASSSRCATPTATWCRWGAWRRCATTSARCSCCATT